MNKKHKASNEDLSLLNLERIFKSDEFHQDWQNMPVWSEDHEGYYQLESGDSGYELVFYDLASERKKTIADSSMFVSEGDSKPLVFNKQGIALEAWCIKPPDFSPNKKYPLVLTVYGMPAAQAVLDVWWGAPNLWYFLLSQMGYIVMSIDNRGTPVLKGKAWRRIIYKKDGILPADDQARALRNILEQRLYIDPERVGVYGWSGGGCLSLHMIFRYPELYKVAMAGAGPSHPKFNHLIVVEKYLGRPQDDPEVYEKTAPLTYAENLKGKLLIVHGLDDESVVFENTEALVEKLVTLGKQFTLMVYPNAGHFLHAIPPTSYHLHALYLDFLKQHLPVT